MIATIEIGYTRSYFEPQQLEFTLPDGERGSGYNVLVGKNNSGKSTLLKLIRDLTINQPRLTVAQEARHDPARPILSLEWILLDEKGKRTINPISIDTSGTGGLFTKSGHATIRQQDFRYVPSRRPFASDFNASASIDLSSYEQNDFVIRRTNLGHVDANLANLIASLPLNSDRGRELISLLRRIDARITAIDADNVGGKDVIRFQSASGRWHPVSDTGDGITNVIRIVHALLTSDPGSCIFVDEPELSLHPQLQRNLYDLLIEHSKSKQIIIVTHSPHFIEWKDICRHGRLIRLFLDESGKSQIRVAQKDTLDTIERHAYGNVTSRKYYDSVCKELFFTDEAVLVEGPDDVHYIANFLEQEGKASLPLMGYGCGGAGNIAAWIQLCTELGIKCAALYDGDKRAEFEAAAARNSTKENSKSACFLLNRDDIRDKYIRDCRGREMSQIATHGVFQRNGLINEDARKAFEIIVDDIRSFLGT
jgi:ABC-type cobalamin/Fe3+-siderophores transport system ATPase subunit